MIDACFKSNAGKKDGTKNHIGADFHFLVYVGGIPDRTEHDARCICTRNISDSKVMFCGIGKKETERKA